ncbi:ABC transporter ATP-binding protein [Corynebacterium rouxii]|uniref:ABC transporter ATP-binding protein n=1 Tax=Corynebacterium rouxii TaxID=2719119 RepID=UPI00313E7972
MSTTIRVNEVSKSFHDQHVLNNVSCDIRPGEVHALLGRNGAGKSTLFSILLGLIPADSGEVTIDISQVGASINGPAFYGHLSARSNVRVHSKLLGLPDSEADRVLDVVGLSDVGSKKARSFSTGMKARLALAQAILGDPDILILDKPQNGLDPQGIRDLRALLRAWAASGKTVLVSSHQLGEVTQLADTVTILAESTIRYSGPLDQLAPQGQLEQEFFRLTQPGVLETGDHHE